MIVGIPGVVTATHEADHRFTVEGFVCGADGRGSANVDVLVKDTRISYGQIVKTDGDGYYKAAFHLHNDNFGDPLLIEALGEQQHRNVSFDPKDLESERRIQVDFGSGCIGDRGHPPQWIIWMLGMASIVFIGVVGTRMIRSWRKRGRKQGKLQGRRGK